MTVSKQVSLHGKRAFITPHDQVVARGGFVAGGDDRPSVVIPGAPDVVAVFDDFLARPLVKINDTGVGAVGRVNHHEGLYFTWIGTDTGNDTKLLDTGGVNGVLRIGPINDGTQTAAGTNTSLVGHNKWKADMGPGAYAGRLRYGIRLKCLGNGALWNAGSIFAGFSDSGSLGAGTFPIYDTGASDTGGIAAVANAVGFLFGENAASGGIRGVSAKGGAAGRQTVTLDTGTQLANKYQVWELELTRGVSDSGGKVTFYIDGVPKGTINSPTTTAEPLVPGIWIMASDTGAPVLDVDWINVSAPRDTGQ